MAKEEILGIGELSKNFKALKEGMEQRTGRAMVVAGGGVIKRKAKANVQQAGLVRTGAYLKNIVIKREPQSPPGTVAYALGVRHGRNLTKKQKTKGKLGVEKGRIVKRYEDDPYYWRFLEFDTAKRSGTPAIGPALEDGRQEAIGAMGTHWQVLRQTELFQPWLRRLPVPRWAAPAWAASSSTWPATPGLRKS